MCLGTYAYDPSVRLRQNHARQDRLPDGRDRQGDHLSRARRALEPGRKPVPLARPEGRRPYRAVDGKPSRVHGDLLGGATQRALLHRDQPLSEAGRDRLHHRRLRRQGRDHHAEMRRPDQGPGQGHRRRADLLHGRRTAARLPLLRQGSGGTADNADRGRGRRLRHAVFVRHDRPAEGHQEGLRRQQDRRAERLPARPLRRHVRHECGEHLSLAGAALSRGSAALQHDGDRARRHLHHHGAF